MSFSFISYVFLLKFILSYAFIVDKKFSKMESAVPYA